MYIYRNSRKYKFLLVLLRLRFKSKKRIIIFFHTLLPQRTLYPAKNYNQPKIQHSKSQLSGAKMAQYITKVAKRAKCND